MQVWGSEVRVVESQVEKKPEHDMETGILSDLIVGN